MNNNTIVGGVIALLVIGGLVFYVTKNKENVKPAEETSTSTGQEAGVGNNTTPPRQSFAPSVITNSNAILSDTTAIVGGSITPNGAFTSYWFEYGLSGDFGSKTSNQIVGSGYSAIPAPGYITGLAKNTIYHFRLVGENQHGRVAGVSYTFRTTEGNPPPVGSAPQVRTLSASGISRTTVNLNGDVDPNRASTRYWFEYGKSADLGNTSALTSVGDGDERVSASISLSSLDPATTYYFRLNAQNQFGTVNGAILNFKTLGPPAGSAPAVNTQNATDIGTTTARLRGTVDPNGLQTMYWFEYGTDSLLGSVLTRSTDRREAGSGDNATARSIDVSNLSPNTAYYFRIVAENSLGTVRGDRQTFTTR